LTLWQDAMHLSGAIEIPEPAVFHGSFTTRALGSLRTMRITASTFRFIRNRAHVARVPRDYLLVNLVQTGTFRGRLARRTLEAGPGDLVLSRHTDLMDLWLADATWLALIIPGDLVERHMRWPARLNGSVYPAGSVPAAMLGGLIATMCELPDTLAPPEVALATVTSLTILATCLQLPPAPPGPNRTDKEQLARSIRHFIAERLADPALDAELLARSFNLSRSALYRVMSETGDIATMIRRLRLHEIRRDILLKGKDRTPLGQIAQQWGITDERTFRRAFAREFGISPSSLRAANSDGVVTEPVESSLYCWFAGL
jgi:AraC-like DNA-binding protein